MDVVDIRNTVSIKEVEFDDYDNIISNSGNIKELRMAFRPYNKKVVPKIYTNHQNSKIINHNYGHGAAGWTLSFGSVMKSIEIFEKDILSKGESLFYIKENKEIAIIGIGCIGLITVLLLHKKGYKKLKVVTHKIDNLASHVAAGLFAFALSPSAIEEEIFNQINTMMLETYLTFVNISDGKHILSDVFNSITKEINYYHDNSANELDYLIDLGYLQKNKKIILKYGKDSEIELWAGKTLLMHTDVILKQGVEYIKSKKIPIEFKYVESFNEVESSIIFNCTGFGSKKLNKDEDLYTGCGHGITLQNQYFSDKFDFILSLTQVPSLINSEYDGFLYFMPKSDGNYFLGVTNIKQYDGKNIKRNREEYKKLIIRAQAFFHEILPSILSKNIKF